MKRTEYMAPFVSREQSKKLHQDYYGQYVTNGIKFIVLSHITLNELIGSKDPYLNDILLVRWDRLVPVLEWHNVPTRLKEQGDSFSLGTGVCILKEAARQIIEAIRTAPKEEAPNGEPWGD